ncbi:pirin family protein [Sulfuriroseicoccus oceanibius]|uniref:Pirin family protein n=1 Tax=Sulfuriroseicoccus oceanibius TaxID=2707525 RepID=A0A6B3L4Q6_9BACT|nr:pirin family protein [Sulfuriroseicoccus oceanibius]QQL46007.1 pirin family protein [Sulfuriroseicoccus oceanibius]
MKTNTQSPIDIMRSEERGFADHGWLVARHSFSFADYYNPERMGFRSLRVINQDRIAPGAGFPRHPHRDMEIFSYLVAGQLQHADSMGNEKVITPGEVQMMSAGRGVLHSEFNPSQTEEAHLLQIWIEPNERGLTPSYTEWQPAEGADPRKVLLISPDGRDQSATIHQDASVYRVKLAAGESISHDLAAGRGAWLQVIHGELTLNGESLKPGDAASSESEGSLTISSAEGTEALLFDLA